MKIIYNLLIQRHRRYIFIAKQRVSSPGIF